MYGLGSMTGRFFVCATLDSVKSGMSRRWQICHLKRKQLLRRPITNTHGSFIIVQSVLKSKCLEWGSFIVFHFLSSGKFSYPTSFFYAAEIVSALEYLHSLSIIYRCVLKSISTRSVEVLEKLRILVVVYIFNISEDVLKYISFFHHLQICAEIYSHSCG